MLAGAGTSATNLSPVNSPLPHVPPPAATSGMVISPATEPFPRKLVDKVNTGYFVEMRKLLADNIAVLHQMEFIQGYPPLLVLGTACPHLREVTSLSTWCYGFLAYMAICTSDPTTRDQLAYACLIIHEALRHGGAGWLDYDRVFRQQAAADPSLQWNTLLPGLQASTIFGHGSGQGPLFCTLCQEVNLTQAQCVLLCLSPPPTRSPIPSTAGTRRRADNICMSWNRRACIFPGNCTYWHVCATCQLAHKIKDFPRIPENSTFKRPRTPMQQQVVTQHAPPTMHP